MNIGLIIASGSGQRMNQSVPKQFISISDKPVILYTLEAFQNNADIDSIIVVCLPGWHETLKAYCKQYNINKLKWIVDGGDNGQSSIRNGVFELEKHCNPDDIVLIHDAIRPNLSADIISSCIAICKVHGSAVTFIPCNEAMLLSDDAKSSNQMIDRSKLVRTQTPQAFPLSKLIWAHKEALHRGITNSIATCTLMIELGENVYLAPGSEKNIKLTVPDDLEIFQSLLGMKKANR